MRNLIALFFLIIIILVTLIGIPIQTIFYHTSKSVSGKIPVLYHRILLFCLGVKVTLQNFDANNSKDNNNNELWISNHISWLDIPILGAIKPISFAARSDMSSWPVVGYLAKMQRTVFISRTQRTKIKSDHQKLQQALKMTNPVVIFPEGTTSNGFKLHPFKSSLIGALINNEKKSDVSDESGLSSANGESGANTIIQPIAIRYKKIDGLPLSINQAHLFAWYGDMSLFPHLWELLKKRNLEVTVYFGKKINKSNQQELFRDRKLLTKFIENDIKNMFIS